MKIQRNRQVAVTVGTTNTVIATECYQERTFISITNTSTGGQNISIGIGQEAIAGSGLFLAPGGTYTESKDSLLPIAQDQFNAISSGAGGTVAVTERVLMEGQ